MDYIGIKRALELYEQQLISQMEAVCHLADGATAPDAAELMELIPSELLTKLRRFVESYEPGKMVTIGGAKELPQETIGFLQAWFETHTSDSE